MTILKEVILNVGYMLHRWRLVIFWYDMHYFGGACLGTK